MSDQVSAAARGSATAAILLALGTLGLLAGLWFGLVNVDYCGSPWSPSREVLLGSPSEMLSATPHCQTVLKTRGALGGGLSAAGGLALLGALVVRVRRRAARRRAS